jgi:hypothetical protein
VDRAAPVHAHLQAPRRLQAAGRQGAQTLMAWACRAFCSPSARLSEKQMVPASQVE